jgi:acyl dehydratase
MLTINGIEDLKSRVGEELGVSDWHEVTQEAVDAFAVATDDHQWIHVDPDRAKLGPFGTTIAHGYLTLSLAPVFIAEILT